MTLNQLLTAVSSGKVPPIILIGGNNEYLVDNAFDEARSAILAKSPGMQVESYPEGADLGAVVDSFRTHSLFGGPRLLVVAEVNAFVTKKELKSLLDKAVDDWSSAKTDRKRASAVSKLLHILGLVGADLEESDASLADAIGAKPGGVLTEMLQAARAGGKRVSRGEGDAALLADAAVNGGAPGATILMRTGEIPADSSTVKAIDKHGVVISCDLSREAFGKAVDQALESVQKESGAKFDAAAVATLKRKLGIERLLADKFSKETPDLRIVVAQAERLATLVGSGGRVTAAVVEEQIAEVTGGARYELAGLFTEGKMVEAVDKLRDLVAQARRDDPRTTNEIHYGKFIFTLADEIRQLIGIHSFVRARKLDVRRLPNYNQFKDSWGDALGEYLKSAGIVKQKPHPFPLYKKVEASRRFNEAQLFQQLARLAEIDFARKSGGVPADVAIESFILTATKM